MIQTSLPLLFGFGVVCTILGIIWGYWFCERNLDKRSKTNG